jgi:tRNA(fMet)-specific endonuclease VapC
VKLLDTDVCIEILCGNQAVIERRRATVPDADLFIAAVALAQQAELVTGNRRHYGRIPDLVIEDWLR